MEDIFCKIVKREIPAKIRYEDEEFISFDDINPKAKIHILLITKKHIPSVAALEDDDAPLIAKMIILAKKIATEAGMESYRLVFNSGKDSGQEVDHIHLHILGGNRLGNMA